MLPAGSIAGFLHVQSKIDLVGEHLDMTLRLHAAAHDAERFPRFAVLHHESGNDGVKWAFARRVNIRVLRVHREKFAAILKHESKTRHNDAAAHAAIIALNERDHVAFVIRRAHVDRIAMIERRVGAISAGSGLRDLRAPASTVLAA